MRIGAFRNEDMSSGCRHSRTRIMTGGPKLLIVKDSATVAEERQARRVLTPPNNKVQRHKAKAVSGRGAKITLVDARSKIPMEP